jgi:hypothetical protein
LHNAITSLQVAAVQRNIIFHLDSILTFLHVDRCLQVTIYNAADDSLFANITVPNSQVS